MSKKVSKKGGTIAAVAALVNGLQEISTQKTPAPTQRQRTPSPIRTPTPAPVPQVDYQVIGNILFRSTTKAKQILRRMLEKASLSEGGLIDEAELCVTKEAVLEKLKDKVDTE